MILRKCVTLILFLCCYFLSENLWASLSLDRTYEADGNDHPAFLKVRLLATIDPVFKVNDQIPCFRSRVTTVFYFEDKGGQSLDFLKNHKDFCFLNSREKRSDGSIMKVGLLEKTFDHYHQFSHYVFPYGCQFVEEFKKEFTSILDGDNIKIKSGGISWKSPHMDIRSFSYFCYPFYLAFDFTNLPYGTLYILEDIKLVQNSLVSYQRNDDSFLLFQNELDDLSDFNIFWQREMGIDSSNISIFEDSQEKISGHTLCFKGNEMTPDGHIISQKKLWMF